MDAYSAALLAALIASSLALGGALATRLGILRSKPSAARFLALLGAVLATVTSIGHWVAGHGAGSDAPLDPGGFVAAHPAPIVALACAVAALLLRPRASEKTP